MRIVQILLPDASLFERKSLHIDRSALASAHEVVEDGPRGAAADIAHVYGPLRSAPRITLPYVAGSPLPRRRFWFARRAEPAAIVSPLDNAREAVSDDYFAASSVRQRTGNVIGTYGRHRHGVMNMVEQTLARIHRFREDVEWRMFDEMPSPADLTLVDVWVDPATLDEDFDGCTAEALVAGKPVVASRTPLNIWRLDKGMSGFLVPVRDPNELTHAILAALFKSEVALKKIEAARQTAGKFRPQQRARALEKIYKAVIA